ncbi:MAG TPA: cytochrome P460 family protein [Terriglobia bacterium]|nr:cytochrome P460 family protein [Terriglobia bacterium]
MNCNWARETLSLYAGGDLSAADADKTSAHLQECGACRNFYEGLAQNQAMLRSLRQTSVTPAALAAMRQELLPRLAGAQLGWWGRFERFLLAEARRPRMAFAGVALAAIVSLTVFAQLRHVTATPNVAAFEGRDMLLLPEDYRTWTVLGSAANAPHAKTAGIGKIYMNPGAFREYQRNGSFPEGTVMVLESTGRSGDAITLEASVKDRRFSEGWGYFRFESAQGDLTKKTKALPEAAGCLACHRDRAATDHVFTQFYPMLRAMSGVQI